MAEQRDWWSRDAETVERDRAAVRVRDDRWLDDFDFEELDDDRDAVSSVWHRWGGSYWGGRSDVDAALKLRDAHRFIQGFADTFATGDRGYRVVFDEAVGTAGTDFRAKKVVISHRPLFDQTLTADEARTVMTAMVAHESAHVRYGRSFFAKVEAERTDSRAGHLANILGDVHDETAFSRDYPGYADVFAPAIEYVARTTFPGARSARLEGLNFVTGAVRYADHVEWASGDVAERDWWQRWAARGARTDNLRTLLGLIDEGLARLDDPQREPEAPTEAPDGPSGPSDDESDDEQSAPSGASGDESEQPETGADQPESGDEQSAGTDSQTGERDDESDESDAGDPGQSASGQTIELPECWADAIDEAARANGMTDDLDDDDAERLVVDGEALTEDGDGEVYWAPGGIATRRATVERNGSAIAAIRAAFARSRTGHYGKQSALRSGRLDNRSLPRIAEHDFRLFSKRTAQSETRYRVWLLVDCSASMQGRAIDQTMEVATALAAATRNLPNVSLDVWGWTSGWRVNGTTFGAVRVYAEGDSVRNIGYLKSVDMGGTPDAQTIRWAAKAIRESLRPGEKPVLLVLSDGSGYLAEGDIETVRKTGVDVLSVAIGRLDRKWQSTIYGENGYVPWLGSISATARPLGRIIARLAGGRGVRS